MNNTHATNGNNNIIYAIYNLPTCSTPNPPDGNGESKFWKIAFIVAAFVALGLLCSIIALTGAGGTFVGILVQIGVGLFTVLLPLIY